MSFFLHIELEDEKCDLISHHGSDIKNFNDTAALIDLMDLAITVHTSVDYLTGAMGKPVWVLFPYKLDWS
jgi:ADP-heptose:LPS heptosyltransferase